jgi:hypothetical protein
MAISKKIRFEVFKRDGFACVYCGRTPPNVLLEADHINPKSIGGEDDINNLATSCFDCNRGKKAIPLSTIPQQISENTEILQEKELQFSEYNKILKKIKTRTNKSIRNIEIIFQGFFPDSKFSPNFKISIKTFLKSLSEKDIIESMEMACDRKQRDGYTATLKYFCGICWHKIKK